jgi:hypothetical protein
LGSLLTEGDLKKLQKKATEAFDKVTEKRVASLATSAPTAPQAEAPTVTPSADDRLSAISKLIPGEAVAIFIGVIGYLKLALPTTPVAWISLGLFVFCLVLAMGIIYFKANNDRVTIPGLPKPIEIPGKYVKIGLTGLAFVIWAFNIEGFLTYVQGAFPGFDPIFGGILLIGYTVLVPEVYAWASKKGT